MRYALAFMYLLVSSGCSVTYVDAREAKVEVDIHAEVCMPTVPSKVLGEVVGDRLGGPTLN